MCVLVHGVSGGKAPEPQWSKKRRRKEKAADV